MLSTRHRHGPLTRAALLAVCALLTATPARAQISLSHPTIEESFSQHYHDLQTDRSVAFAMTSDLTLTSVGMRLRPLPGEPWFKLRATLRSVSNVFGLQRGNILAEATAIMSPAGNAYYDLPLSFTLLGGQRYDIAFNIVELAPNLEPWVLKDWFGLYQVFDQASDPSFTVNGNIRVLDGGRFNVDNPHPSTGYSSVVLPQVRFNAPIVTVPEPSTYALLGAGLLGVGVVARRRRR